MDMNWRNFRFIQYLKHIKKLYQKHQRLFERENDLLFLCKAFLKTRIVMRSDDAAKDFQNLCQKASFHKQGCYQYFYYYINPYLSLSQRHHVFSNITIAYEKFIQNSFQALLTEGENLPNTSFKKQQNCVLLAIMTQIETISTKLHAMQRFDLQQLFAEMVQGEARHLQDGMQRILFLNQMLWQSGHELVGLGRFDALLFQLYEQDLQTGYITEEKAKSMLLEFCHILHQDYWFKSSELLGDTGQILILGGKDLQANTAFTKLILQVFEKYDKPEPKLLYRYTQTCPNVIKEQIFRVLKKGNGSPLLSNDDVILTCLQQAGIAQVDALHYGTSACWEPLLIGKDSSQNNTSILNLLVPIVKLMNDDLLTREEVYQRYFSYLKEEILRICQASKALVYEKDAFLTLCIDGCWQSVKDVAEGGACYHNTGITTVAMGNAINALFNIEELVYKKKLFTLAQLQMYLEDAEHGEQFRYFLQQKGVFGDDEQKTMISRINQITAYAAQVFAEEKNQWGGHFVFGLSSPGYVSSAATFPATADGRAYGEPFMTHISGIAGRAYTSLLNFAAKLHYDHGRCNGNVVDIMMNPQLLNNFEDKCRTLLFCALDHGIFQLQMNVLQKDVLLDAQQHPKKHADLIVRVWGFSAYFIDLPKSYQDIVIRRCEEYETVYH